jgi:hypothetical protein
MSVKDMSTPKLKRYYFRWLKEAWRWQRKAPGDYDGPARAGNGLYPNFQSSVTHARYSFDMVVAIREELEHRGFRFE